MSTTRLSSAGNAMLAIDERRSSGKPDLVPSFQNIDPLIFPLVDALNRTGLVTTHASCQGHWGIGEPYLAFSANLQFAEHMDAWLNHAYGRDELENYWQMPASFGLDRTLWFRLSGSSIFDSRLYFKFRWKRRHRSLIRDIERIACWVSAYRKTP